MDYSQGNHLHKQQWDYIHHPQDVIGWFEDDEEVEDHVYTGTGTYTIHSVWLSYFLDSKIFENGGESLSDLDIFKIIKPYLKKDYEEGGSTEIRGNKSFAFKYFEYDGNRICSIQDTEEFRIVGYLKTGNNQITKVVLWPYRQMSILDQIELIGMDNNEKEWQAVKMTNLYLSNEVAEQTAKDKEFTVDATIVATDIAFTVATAGVFTVGKTALQIGTKVSIGALTDFVLQVTILSMDGTDVESILEKIEYDQVAWSGVEILIDNWSTQVLLSCMRNSVNYLSENQGLDINFMVSSCGENALTGFFTNKVFNEKYFLLLKKVATKSPRVVADNLVRIGCDINTIAWISSKIGLDLIKYYSE